MNLTTRDIVYMGIGLTALAFGSIANYENQQLRRELEAGIARSQQDVGEVRAFCIEEDMQLLRLENQTRERVGLDVINYGIAKER